jgi:hypothetical protein
MAKVARYSLVAGLPSGGARWKPLQVTIYLTDADEYLLRLVEARSLRERKSRSAVMLSILEEHFEKTHRLGEILVDLGALSPTDLAEVLELQERSFTDKLLGELLVSERGVSIDAVERAMTIQSRFREEERQL